MRKFPDFEELSDLEAGELRTCYKAMQRLLIKQDAEVKELKKKLDELVGSPKGVA
jgi:hypothetical protein